MVSKFLFAYQFVVESDDDRALNRDGAVSNHLRSRPA
jgi:hypothetical protein